MLPFEQYSNILLSGVSASGKSHFLHRLCKHAKVMFYPTPVTRIIYVYRHYQDSFQELMKEVDNITFTTKIPDEEQLRDLVKGHAHSLLILDDALDALLNNPICQDYCVRLSHHLRTSVVFSAQTGRLKGKFGPDISKNIHANIVMKSPKEIQLIRSLGLMLGRYALLRSAYENATRDPYTYLCIVTHPKRDVDLQLSSNIFPDDKDPTYVYINKDE